MLGKMGFPGLSNAWGKAKLAEGKKQSKTEEWELRSAARGRRMPCLGCVCVCVCVCLQTALLFRQVARLPVWWLDDCSQWLDGLTSWVHENTKSAPRLHSHWHANTQGSQFKNTHTQIFPNPVTRNLTITAKRLMLTLTWSLTQF